MKTCNRKTVSSIPSKKDSNIEPKGMDVTIVLNEQDFPQESNYKVTRKMVGRWWFL